MRAPAAAASAGTRAGRGRRPGSRRRRTLVPLVERLDVDGADLAWPRCCRTRTRWPPMKPPAPVTTTRSSLDIDEPFMRSAGIRFSKILRVRLAHPVNSPSALGRSCERTAVAITSPKCRDNCRARSAAARQQGWERWWVERTFLFKSHAPGPSKHRSYHPSSCLLAANLGRGPMCARLAAVRHACPPIRVAVR